MLGKVLVANRGEIAARILRTCRRLGIPTVAVYSDADRGALHTQLADEAVHLGASRAQDSYLNLPALVDAISSTGALAVHPGYGLLSESAAFAAAVRAAGAVFVGPDEQNLERFGDKLSSRAFAAQCGIPSAPGVDSALDPSDESELQTAASNVGYPVLVKASAGGGGIGMQPVTDPGALSQAVETCSARGQAAFGDGRVYLERFVEKPRHIEVQVLADGQGGVVALGDRDCSVQRRHQKVLEESPSPATQLVKTADRDLRATIHRQAETLIRTAGYQGAATVEFLADFSSPEPTLYFLEVNARLQVEHPVTELVYGIDLVEAQLRIASGQALPAEILGAEPRGHAVEVRLYAEDPARKFMPQPGELQQLDWPTDAQLEPVVGRDDQPVVRVDSGFVGGDAITPFYDPLIAKLIAWAPDRDSAFNALGAALGQTAISLSGPKGPRVTNLELLKQLTAEPRVRSGDYDTGVLKAMGY